MPTYYVPFITDKTPEELAKQCNDFDMHEVSLADCPVTTCPFVMIRCSKVTAEDWDEMLLKI